MTDKTPGQDLGDTLKDTPSRVVDTLTLGPQRRSAGKWIDEKESEVENWINKPVGKRSMPKAAVQQKSPARRATARKRSY